MATTTAVIEAALAYQNQAIMQPIVDSKVAALLHDPSRFQFAKAGAKTYVREVTGGNAVDYDPAEGFHGASSGGSVEWVEFNAPFDRAIVDSIDTVKDLDSFLAGMTPSSKLLNDQTWRNFAAELDAVSIASITNTTNSANIYTDSTPGFSLEPDQFMSTLINIQQKIFSGVGVANGQGYSGDVLAFVDSEVFGAYMTYISSKYALANPTILHPTKRTIPMTLVPGHEKLTINVDFYEFQTGYGTILLNVVPSSRMYREVELLDGRGNSGGFVPAEGAEHVRLLVVPKEGAVLSIRHFVAGLSLPMVLGVYEEIFKRPETLDFLFNYYGGRVDFTDMGVTQLADAIQFKSRIKYGVAHFKTYRKLTYAVLGETFTPTSLVVTPATVEVEEGAEEALTFEITDGDTTVEVPADSKYISVQVLDTDTATYADGKVTGVAQGTTQLIVVYTGSSTPLITTVDVTVTTPA